MEKQANKLKIPLLILAIVLVLGGGGFAIWMVTKKEDDPNLGQPQEGADKPPVRGRLNASDFYSEEELYTSSLVNEDSPDNRPEYTAVLMTSNDGLRLIGDRMIKLQQNKHDADKIRARYDVGRTLVNNKAFSPAANKAIDKMFGLIDGVTGGDWKTYPVYGTHETDAASLIRDIDNFLSKDGQGYNLTNLRHGGNAWWFGSVGLNLMYGNGSSHLHSADQIWWYKADREGLDFFKLVNGHDVGDRRLTDDKRNGQGTFAAWGMYNLVKEWKAQIDYFDKVTREEAITALEREGMIRRI